jgi:cell division septation protein DedD
MPRPATTAAPEITTLDRSPESATSALYRAAIGPINTSYYLPLFTRFEVAERSGPSWNWAASLYTLNWMIFRRLWAAAGIYVVAMLGVLLVVFGIGRLLFHGSESVELGLVVCCVLSFGVPGVFGNAIFHANSRQKMASALSATSTLMDACTRLNQQASSRQRFIWLVSANLVLAGLVPLVYGAFPVAPTTPPVGQGAKSVMVAPLQSAPVIASPSPSIATDPTPMQAPVSPIAPSQVVSAQAAVNPAITPVSKTAPPEPKSTPQHPASAPVAGRPYFINVGLFAKIGNARNAYAKLRDVGLPAFTQALKGRTRVRVGPFDTQPEADAVAEQIHALQLDAVVFQP